MPCSVAKKINKLKIFFTQNTHTHTYRRFRSIEKVILEKFVTNAKLAIGPLVGSRPLPHSSLRTDL